MLYLNQKQLLIISGLLCVLHNGSYITAADKKRSFNELLNTCNSPEKKQAISPEARLRVLPNQITAHKKKSPLPRFNITSSARRSLIFPNIEEIEQLLNKPAGIYSSATSFMKSLFNSRNNAYFHTHKARIETTHTETYPRINDNYLGVMMVGRNNFSVEMLQQIFVKTEDYSDGEKLFKKVDEQTFKRKELAIDNNNNKPSIV